MLNNPDKDVEVVFDLVEAWSTKTTFNKLETRDFDQTIQTMICRGLSDGTCLLKIKSQRVSGVNPNIRMTTLKEWLIQYTSKQFVLIQ